MYGLFPVDLRSLEYVSDEVAEELHELVLLPGPGGGGLGGGRGDRGSGYRGPRLRRWGRRPEENNCLSDIKKRTIFRVFGGIDVQCASASIFVSRSGSKPKKIPDLEGHGDFPSPLV